MLLYIVFYIYMLFYTHVVWRLKNDNIDLKYILGKEKHKLLSKGLIYMNQNGYSFGTESLTLESLSEFYTSIYQQEIQKKTNANVIDLITLLTPRIGKENIQFAFIRKNNILLAGGIFIGKFDNNATVFNLGYRSYKDSKIEGLSLGYYIEYFFYKRCLENNADFLSRGKDRNCYGLLGGNVGLPLHKLQYKFLPYRLGKTNQEISLEESSIHKETLIFVEPNDNNLYTKAILYTNKTLEDIKKEFAVIEKRGLQLEVRSFI